MPTATPCSILLTPCHPCSAAADLALRPEHPTIPYLENLEDQPDMGYTAAALQAAKAAAVGAQAQAVPASSAPAATPMGWPATPVSSAPTAADPEGVLKRSSIAEAAARAAPSVVHLVVSGQNQTASLLQGRSSTGSGFIFHPQGWILTNAHVVLGAMEGGDKQLMVTMQDGRVFEGSVERIDK
jgi:S1-C subfamily serine protease